MSDLRCYCCGKPVDEHFMLVAMSKNVDRVFIVHVEPCLKLVTEDAEVAVEVKVSE